MGTCSGLASKPLTNRWMLCSSLVAASFSAQDLGDKDSELEESVEESVEERLLSSEPESTATEAGLEARAATLPSRGPAAAAMEGGGEQAAAVGDRHQDRVGAVAQPRAHGVQIEEGVAVHRAGSRRSHVRVRVREQPSERGHGQALRSQDVLLEVEGQGGRGSPGQSLRCGGRGHGHRIQAEMPVEPPDTVARRGPMPAAAMLEKAPPMANWPGCRKSGCPLKNCWPARSGRSRGWAVGPGPKAQRPRPSAP
ncbi:hypothetical protein P7K49_013065 [Saguinus oedipus]|uniref:Uncharacterized protein n=1 Tax=Saguinus oedipus TaxID=9490 RepID=A0ABQ9VEU2_SAGOE|nr:hypothetical protein P7K49_013065 [Saguinus oedipus]